MSTPNPIVPLIFIIFIILLLSSLHHKVQYIMFIPVNVSLLRYIMRLNRILARECVTAYLQQEVKVFWLSSYGHLINIPRMFQSWVNISPRTGQ